MFDVTALGELLIDFTPSGLSPGGNELFEKNPGGAPANVLAAVRKLGKSAAFLGMVGKDQFGEFLRNVLKENGIDISGLMFSEKANTTLAFVHLNSKGDRSFSFYRNPGADMMISEEDINFDVIRNSRVFHFGSISLTHEPARYATLAAAKYASENGLIISYDPNLRPPLWKSLDDAKDKIKLGLKYAGIVKISEEELEFITGTANLENGSRILYDMGVSVIFVTLGPKGCYYRYKGGAGRLYTYDTRVIDTTGAGDAFLGGVLFRLSGMNMKEIEELPKEEFESVVDFGNAVGSLATTKKGAIPALPYIHEVIKCQKEVPLLKAVGD